MFKFNTNNIKILTPDGYQLFKGIQILQKPCISISTLTYSLTCSTYHPLCVNFEERMFIPAEKLKIDTKIYTQTGYEMIVNIEHLGTHDVYDIVGIESIPAYFTNGILSHNCEFLENGESFIDEAFLYEMSKKCSDPKIILDEGHYKIWDEPNPTRVYVAGVDISEGVGIDASVIQIMDITDIKDIRQVAVYHNNQIPPLEFSNKLYSILKNWGSPLALIERNNCGAQVCDRLAFDMGYEKVVSYGAKVARRERPQMGMIAHTNTKYKGVMNMRYFIHEVKAVTLQDINTLKELKDFVRYPNGSWKAKGGYHDDRVMSMLYAIYILEKELTERYFDILELDDHGKPSAIEIMDFGVARFEDATSIYNDAELMGNNSAHMTPIVFGMGGSDDQSDMDTLVADGWVPLGR